MVKLTRITNYNRETFAPLLFDGSGASASDQIRFGAVCETEPSRSAGSSEPDAETAESAPAAQAAGAASLFLHGEYAQLSSLYVSPDHRREGIGTEMLSYAETVAREYGKGFIESYFPDDVEGMEPFLERNGYFTTPRESFYCLMLKDLANSERLKKLMQKKIDRHLTVKSYGKFTQSEKNEVMNLLDANGFRLRPNVLPHLEKKLSSAVFDSEGTIQMAMIVSAHAPMIFVEQLAGRTEKSGAINPKFVHAQFSYFIQQIARQYRKKEAMYREIRFLTDRDSIVTFLNEILGDGKEMETIARLIYAVKVL